MGIYIECPNCFGDDWNEPEPTFFDRDTIERLLECDACVTRYLVRYEAIGLSEQIEPADNKRLRKLARDAKPVNDADYGTERQVEAENLFWQFVETIVSISKYNEMTNKIEGYKMTSEEAIKYGVEVAEWALRAKQSFATSSS